MFRKFAVSALAIAVLGGALVATPASAATKISNGVPCTKSGATTKANGSTYKCAKNILVANSKLTWLTTDCVQALTVYTKAQVEVKKLQDNSATLAGFDAQITETTANLETATTKYNKAKEALTSARDAMNKAVSGSETQKTLTAAVNSLSASLLKIAGSIATLKTQLSTLTRARKTMADTPGKVKASVASAKSSAQTLCTKGW